MNDTPPLLWQTKLAARLHDPVEKALVLMRSAEGHEGGTSRTLREELGLTDLPATARRAVERADHWASAADRAAFPRHADDHPYPTWQNVRFHECPVIIHPLTGEKFAITKLTDVEPAAAKALALDHLRGLVHEGDLRRTALAFWRFGPEIDAGEIKSLWAQLPADSRVPDHTIFDHLDLSSALAACFALDEGGGPALLAVSLGPVQEFIAAARSTSDLWAGSHLLSRLAWEAMRVVCEALGPEAILFPRLRAVPQVDLWLRDQCGLEASLFERCVWTNSASDANPLFAAALPNRFTALVPSSQAREIAERLTARVREWVLARTKEAWGLLLEAAGTPHEPGLAGDAQITEQLRGFPEVHWAAVPWSLVETDDQDHVEPGAQQLAEAMRPFFDSDPPGYLGTVAWGLLRRGIALDKGWFWRPNPGALYPALHELLERALAATKSVRPFEQGAQHGWRDSLSGEAEWLTTDRAHLDLPPGRRTETLWARVAAKHPAWVRRGEHLSALATLKRLWPTLLMSELSATLDADVRRFVVSTHTMALATSLARAVRAGRAVPAGLARAAGEHGTERVALPRKLAAELRGHPDRAVLAAIPGLLEAAREAEDDEEICRTELLLAEYLGALPEAYYGLLLMDGDRMGAWLSADRELTQPHAKSFHPQIRQGLGRFSEDDAMRRYAAELRAPSPSRHMAISEALNHFALTLAPAMVEECHHGRVLYAGGDDLMAMLPVAELLPAMAALRAAYSGIEPAAAGVEEIETGLRRQANGFVLYRARLLRVMGEQATASCGAVVAHHQAPLGAVLRELHAAEERAKDVEGKDAFSLSVVKRSGGALYLTARWGEPVRLLIRLRDFLAEPDVSRRAVFNAARWLRDLPPPEGEGEMVAGMLAYQLKRQTGRKTTLDAYALPDLAADLARLAIAEAEPAARLSWLENFLSVAEFLARETRSPSLLGTEGAREAAR